jgi:hypothetical protein
MTRLADSSVSEESSWPPMRILPASVRSWMDRFRLDSSERPAGRTLAAIRQGAAADLADRVRSGIASARPAARRAGADLLRYAARLRDGGLDRLRQQTGEHLVRATIVACAAIGVVRRTGVAVLIRRGGRRLAILARAAWAEAEGFEVEAAAGIALVALSIVIVLHGWLSG